MRKIGIICEYNPFHNGHIYHLQKIKEMYPDSLIVLVMSSSFTQRGTVSILNKWEKTDIALKYGIDLVIELPFIYSSQGADIFSYGAIAILKKLQIDTLVFGSESNDPDKLVNLANIQINNPKYDYLVKKYLDKGENYPTSMSLAIKDLYGESISLPNDLLGLSYTKEILRQNANIKIVTIKRTNNFHDTKIDKNIVSATAIRNNLDNKELIKCVPIETYNYLKNKNLDNNYFLFLKYKILNEQEQISKYQTVDEGIHNRIIKAIDNSSSLENFIKVVKTKRYTYNKIHRMCSHILCGFTKEEAKDINLKYIRVLGFNTKGKELLNKIKKDIDIPIITNYKKEYSELLKLETKVDKIYSIVMNDKNNDYKRKPIQIKN